MNAWSSHVALGVDIAALRCLITKSRSHFRAAFDEFFPGERIVEVDVPGLTTPVLQSVPYRHIPRPLCPLDEDQGFTVGEPQMFAARGARRVISSSTGTIEEHFMFAHVVRSIGLVGLLSIVLAFPAAQAQQPSARNKLVVQVSDADASKWNLALNNAKNVQTDLGAANVDIEIVAYGPGIGMLKADSVVGNRIGEALAAGVKVLACENTMRNQKLVKDEMLPKIGYVSAGVVEIMQKQQQGWAYIRP